MSKWKMVKLSEIFNLQMGKTPSRNNLNYWNDGTNKWVSIADLSKSDKYIIDTKESISNIAVSESGIKLVPKNTVIMSFKLSLGKTAITCEDVYTNEAIMAFHNLGKYKTDNNYIFHLFTGFDWTSSTNKAVMGATLNKATLSNVKIPLPPLEEQKRIAKNLDLASEIVTGYKTQLEELDKLIQSVFYDMFGDPVTNEKGWEVEKLKNSTKVITGNTPPRNDIDNYGDHIEWIKSDNITNMLYLTTAKEYLSEIGLSKGRYVDKDTILMTCIAGSLKSIGRVALANRSVAFNQQINAIIPIKYNTLFLYSLFNQTQTYIQSTINMSLKGILSKGKLECLEFILPPLPLQQKFADIVTEMETQKAQVQKALNDAEQLYNSLMQEYFE